uniref:Uncharacterized protein n=1 Tax=Glossina pallidipes TaxID=7398 RepID=A0A1A9ZI69_GLOPL
MENMDLRPCAPLIVKELRTTSTFRILQMHCISFRNNLWLSIGVLLKYMICGIKFLFSLSKRQVYSACAPPMHGLRVAYAWIVHCPCTSYELPMHGLCLGYAPYYAPPMHGLCMAYGWVEQRLCTCYELLMHGLCVDCAPSMHRLCVDYAWPIDGLYTAYASPMNYLCMTYAGPCTTYRPPVVVGCKQ